MVMTQDQINQLIGAALPVVIALLIWTAQSLTAYNARKKITAQATAVQAQANDVATRQKDLEKRRDEFEERSREVDLKVQETLANVANDQLRQRTEHEAEMKRRDKANAEALKTLKETLDGEHSKALESLKATLQKDNETALSKLKTTHADELTTLGRQIQDLREQFSKVEKERDTALEAVKQKNSELEAQKKEVIARDEKIAKLEQDLAETRERVETLQKRVDELEKKPDTGKLNPSNLPPQESLPPHSGEESTNSSALGEKKE